MRNRSIVLCVLSCALFIGCRVRQKVNLIIKTGVHSFDTTIDADVPDAYTLLKKASADFIANYRYAAVTAAVSQYESARRSAEVDGCFGTPLSPDILFASQFNLTAYAYEGYLVPLDDILDGGIKDDIMDGCMNNCVINGKTYMVPYVTMQNVLCFNKALFRMAGLDRYCDTDEVQSWTLEEWDDVLSSLRALLPHNVYPMMMYGADEQGDTHIMTLLRSRGSSFYDETGHVHLDTSGGIAALEWLRKCNELGYFPPHPERLVIMDNYELFVAGQLAIYIANKTIQQYFTDCGIECGYVNFPSIDGVGFNTLFDMSFAVVDNGDVAKLRAAKALITHIYTSTWLDYCAGSIPVSRRVATKYAARLGEVSRYINNHACNVNFFANCPNWIGVRAVFYPHIHDLFITDKSTAQIAQEIDTDCNAAIDEGRRTSRPHE